MDEVNSNISVEKLIFQVECPACRSVFSVDRNEFAELRPRFQCLKCAVRFWISVPDVMTGDAMLVQGIMERENSAVVPPTVKKQEPFNCPKCSTPYGLGQKECGHCGVVFEKFLELKIAKDGGPTASKDLRQMWDDVLLEYSDFSVHQKFIDTSLAENSLSFALSKYDELYNLNPNDDLVNRARLQLQTLMREKSTMNPMLHPPIEQNSWMNFKIPKISIATLIYFICGMLVVAGSLIPGARNLIGLGGVVIFLMLSLRFYFRIF